MKKFARKNFGLERYTTEQNSNKFRGYVPLVEVVQVSKLNNYRPPQEKKKYQNCTIPLGFSGAVLGVDPWGSKW